jgi:hypothetical protein
MWLVRLGGYLWFCELTWPRMMRWIQMDWMDGLDVLVGFRKT